MNKELQQLAIALASGKSYENYAFEDMHEAFRREVNTLVCDDRGNIDYYKWKQHGVEVFALMSTMADIISPKEVKETIGMFAEVKEFRDGDKPRFLLKTGSKNVRRFVTRVAAAGVYERVRLDRDFLDIEMYAHGGAVYQTLEGFLAGRENVTELVKLLIDGLTDEVYNDMAVALHGTVDQMPAANKHVAAGFDAKEFNRILATVRAYGTPTIFCTQEFAANIVPDPAFIGAEDKSDMRNRGYIGKYLGSDVVILPQSFTDSTNTQKVIDPSYCYIMPGGANAEKPVKVAYEGPTKIREVEGADWSTEIQLYRKIGVAVLHNNYYGIYRDTKLEMTM